MDPRVRAGIFAGESGGDYNALFGFSNRPGGRWADTKLTDMTINDAINFSDPSGPYAQWVQNQIGRVATPMGAYQIVGNTLRQALKWAGLSGNERMTPEVQDLLGDAILANQGTGAWAGYRGPREPSSTPNTTVENRYDPRDDTPSPGRPWSQDLPGPTGGQYSVHTRHPPNPATGSGGYGRTGGGYAPLPQPGTKELDREDPMAAAGQAVADAGKRSVPQFDMPLTQVQPNAPMPAQPFADPMAADNRRNLAMLMMQRLNTGKLWG